MNNRALEKYKDIRGMSKAVSELLAQAWERGRKFGYVTGYEDGMNYGCLSTGKWVVDIIGYKGDKTTSMRFKCSNCGTIISWIPGEKYPTKESFLDAHPWCFCGAKMKGGDNE